MMAPVQDAARIKLLPRDLLEAMQACSGAASGSVRPPAVGCGSLKNSLMKDMVFISKMKIDVEPSVLRTQPALPTAHSQGLGCALPTKSGPGNILFLRLIFWGGGWGGGWGRDTGTYLFLIKEKS